jgi:GNAT superfamily N-acetyltransferase
MSKHYEAFMKEYLGFEIAEYPHGCISYRLNPEHNAVEVDAIYTEPGHRKKGYGSAMMNEQIAKWKAAGYSAFYSKIYLSYEGKETSLLASLKFGAKVLAADNIKITVGKEF